MLETVVEPVNIQDRVKTWLGFDVQKLQCQEKDVASGGFDHRLKGEQRDVITQVQREIQQGHLNKEKTWTRWCLLRKEGVRDKR